MEIRQLKYFLAVADARSFLNAAGKLYVSRQAVSKTITQLEDELNVELFVRNQNGAMMTPAGIYFYPRAATITADFDKLRQEMLAIDRTYRPQINVCMAFGVYNIYASILTAYAAQRHNELDIRLNGCLDTDCEAELTGRRADMVLSIAPIKNKMVDTTVVLESPVQLLLGRNDPLADKAELTPEDLEQATGLLYTGGHEESCFPWPFSQRIIRSNDLSHLFTLLSTGRGVMPLAEVAVPAYIRELTVARPFPVRTDRWKVYCSLLSASYYNFYMYNMMGEMYSDVFASENPH